jgi:hypothetical protein
MFLLLGLPQPRHRFLLDRRKFFRSANLHHQIHLPTYYCLPIHYRFALKTATAKFAETLDNFQHPLRIIPESRSCEQHVAVSEHIEQEEMIVYIGQCGLV